MDSIANLLPTYSQEPSKLEALKAYVLEHHQTGVGVRVSDNGYTLIVPNAPLANNLRMEVPQIIEACDLDKKLFIRIGHVE